MDFIANLILGLMHSLEWLLAMFLTFLIIVSILPQDNPLRGVLVTVTKRIGATLAVGAIAIPVEFIPFLDIIYDLAAPIGLAWYWLSMFAGSPKKSIKAQ
jgi:hypothetical protein